MTFAQPAFETALFSLMWAHVDTIPLYITIHTVNPYSLCPRYCRVYSDMLRDMLSGLVLAWYSWTQFPSVVGGVADEDADMNGTCGKIGAG